jgi:hypothetical protein
MVIHYTDPDDGDREEIRDVGLGSTLTWLIAREDSGTFIRSESKILFSKILQTWPLILLGKYPTVSLVHYRAKVK